MVPEQDDAALVAIAKRRGIPGQDAFEALVDRHQQWLVRFLMHLMGSVDDAQDVAQETFVRAFLAIEDCHQGDRFRGWLRVIARRLAFNYSRDARTRARYEERSNELRADTEEPTAERIEGRQLLEHALGHLAYPYREIMVLRFVEELPVKEIAEVLAISESAAKMRLLRARAEFQRNYETLGGGDGGR